jgi:peptidoglycan/xylan/chitin deacetylase (PgdA/CDA1 family)
MRRVAVAVALLLASCTSIPANNPGPEIAITIDDLPVHAPYPPGVTPTQVNEQMIAALKAGGVPVIGFVNGVGTEQHPETLDVLPEWPAAGLLLGNHTWTHPHLSEITIPQFEDELMKGDQMLSRLGDGSDWRWFRYPFLDEGKDEAQRAAARQVLAKHGYRVADVTTSFSDWAFTPAWARCNAAGDKAAVAELERMYMDAAKESISVARGTSHALYGRDIPYVLLMHISAISAHMMPQVITLYRDAGFRFVTIRQAESDPVYRPDIDLSLPGRVPDWKLAQQKGVKLPQATDLGAKLNTMCASLKL